MRVLLLLRGSAGCGKSTYIKEHGLEPYTLSSDNIRMMCSAPVLNTEGKFGISQDNDKTVWSTLFRLLETRMSKGEFTVIDATNSKTSEMNRYKELAALYRYRIYCIDMTNIPIDEVKRRNILREPLKRVPDEVIDKFYSRFETQQVPSGIKVLKPEELDTIWYRPTDLSSYKKVHVFGDIHGCYTVLQEYFDSNGGIKPDECYIFCGDYIDRGIENVETVKFLCEQASYPNIFFLEGNHERWLWRWANDMVSDSKEFEFITKPQLNRGLVSKKAVRQFCRGLGQCCYFTYHGKTVLATHGGLSSLPDNLTTISTSQMIRGVGQYKEADEVDKAFSEHTKENIYQVHGHRNVMGSPVQSSERTFNLEGGVELGGHLRVVQLTPDGIFPIEIKNNVYKTSEEAAINVGEIKDMSVYAAIEGMRINKHINEKQFGKISSFNFSKNTFEKGIWNTMTTKARGLYIDNSNYTVIARAYDKFFNINERPETEFANLHYKLQFPINAYVKENGFLGIVGWNPDEDDLLITTKSNPFGCYSEWLREDLYQIYGEDTMNKIREYIKENNVSFVFECCDVERDPHIIAYPKTKVVLLDIVKNSLEYEKLPYSELKSIADSFGLSVKKHAYEIQSWEDFCTWYAEATSEDYKYNGDYIEGFVVEDSVGYMVKLKLHYYKLWKKLRGVACSVLKYGNYKYTGSLLTPLENEFFGWCKSLYSDLPNEKRLELRGKTETNICSLRDRFFEWKRGAENG